MEVDANRCLPALAALSLSMDAANGRPYETSLRVTLLATSLAEAAGCSTLERAYAFHMGLLRFLGCTSFSHEEAALFGGDDVKTRSMFGHIDQTDRAEVIAATLARVSEEPWPARARRLANIAVSASSTRAEFAATTCQVGHALATRVGMPAQVCNALHQIHERWDGRGLPGGLEGTQTELTHRIVQVAYVAEMARIAAGSEAAIATVRERSGKQLDPTLAQVFLRNADRFLAAVAVPSVWTQVLESAPAERVAQPTLDDITLAFADFADLKSTHTLGHGRAVATLVGKAGAVAKLDEADLFILRHAGRLHDIGHVGVSTGLWEQREPLSDAQWDHIRLHPVHTERALARSAALAPAAKLCVSHHERLDGSGYPSSAPASAQCFSARLLAAADVYQALREERPYRRALAPTEASSVLEREVADGRLDREAVAAVLEAADDPARPSALPWPAGLTNREVETLRLVAVGLSNKEIGKELGISWRTAQHHVQNGYEKLGVSTRAAAALKLIDLDLLRR